MGDNFRQRILSMATKWITVAPGIRCREHESRRHGVKPDRYFTLRFYVEGKRVEEALGWSSEGWTLNRAKAELIKLKEAKRTGQGETTLTEKRATATTKRKTEAQKIEEDTRRNVTLACYFNDTYRPWAVATKAKAFVREEQIWRVWLNPALGNLPIGSIKLGQWDHLVKTLSAAGQSDRSVEYATGTLRRILNHALERRVISEAPPPGRIIGASAATNNRRQRVLTEEELQAFLAALKERDIFAWRVTLFAAGTGCRAGEAFALRWTDIDLERGTATFPKTKSGRPRVVPLGGEILAMLADLQAGEQTALVFPNSLGRPYAIAPTSFRKLADDMGLNEGRGVHDRFTFHSLRHMAATKLARVLPLRGLMDVLGWTVAAMALRYSHTADADMHIAAQALDAALRPAVEAKVVPIRTKRGGA